ncbi:uncharacterized protein LACBIDRAFT_334459 [Laccaria bicolor S238N-H82]|uniref:Predicted protein n=1 Tax=Laccaria bicolor (strain S238N-H82 / ATCC MYA-4686) TaxID=486041 RepID=B0DZ98_LACBS|nr:uncharacterized protein LACBIDRAFT_334459 [Laccaria bicolor S238N-H82]EDR00051.1 predicted protein [Laccaria bicolor S238N-H82]|eukprot:XP_001889257.1 predicted protein [Laccaria bicolor S238N-H82]
MATAASFFISPCASCGGITRFPLALFFVVPLASLDPSQITLFKGYRPADFRARPGWVEDLLPYILASNLRFLSIQYDGAKYTNPQRVLGIITNLLESASSVRVMKLKIRGDLKLHPELFIHSKDHLHLQHLILDCISLSAPSLLSCVGQFPSLTRLKIRVQKGFPVLFKNTITLSRLSRLELAACETEIAVAFLGCIKNLANVTDVIISIEEILPFEHELRQVSYEIQRLCSPRFLQYLNISFNDFGSPREAPPPLMPENPGFSLQTFLPLIANFSLRVLNLSLQLPLLLSSRNLTVEMASAWTNLVSIRIDPGHLIPQDGDAAIPFQKLIAFFQVCKRLRQLYIPFQYAASDRLPCIPATFLYDLGLGYISPRSEEMLILARWLRVVAPALPEVSLVDGRGDIVVYSIYELIDESDVFGSVG